MDTPSHQLSFSTYNWLILSKGIYLTCIVHIKHSQFDVCHQTVIDGWWCAIASTLKQKSSMLPGRCV